MAINLKHLATLNEIHKEKKALEKKLALVEKVEEFHRLINYYTEKTEARILREANEGKTSIYIHTTEHMMNFECTMRYIFLKSNKSWEEIDSWVMESSYKAESIAIGYVTLQYEKQGFEVWFSGGRNAISWENISENKNYNPKDNDEPTREAQKKLAELQKLNQRANEILNS